MESYAKRADGTPSGNRGFDNDVLESNILAILLENKRVSSDQIDSWCRKGASPYALVGVKSFSPQTQVEGSSFADILSNVPSYCVSTIKDNLLFVLVSFEDIRQIIDIVTEKGKSSRYATAYSLPFTNLYAVFQQHSLIAFCLENAKQGSVYNAKDQALSYLVTEITSSIDVTSFLHPALEKLDRYDKTNQSSLLETLRAYLNHDCNAQRCANELYLHRNSLQYRVRRIQEIAGVSLDNPEERAYLRLSFLLRP